MQSQACIYKMLSRIRYENTAYLCSCDSAPSVSHDIRHFPKLFSQMKNIVTMQIMALDKGYDAEPMHKMIRDENVISMIPVRNRDCLISRTKGRYRKLMRREFDESLYHERNKTETIFSVIKRRFDSEIKSYDDYSMKTKDYSIECWLVIVTECVSFH